MDLRPDRWDKADKVSRTPNKYGLSPALGRHCSLSERVLRFGGPSFVFGDILCSVAAPPVLFQRPSYPRTCTPESNVGLPYDSLPMACNWPGCGRSAFRDQTSQCERITEQDA